MSGYTVATRSLVRRREVKHDEENAMAFHQRLALLEIAAIFVHAIPISAPGVVSISPQYNGHPFCLRVTLSF